MIVSLLGMLLTASLLTAQTANRAKMSPLLADMMAAGVAAARGAEPEQEEYVMALVKLADNNQNTLAEHGCTVIDRVGAICIALLPVSQLASLSMDDRVVRMEANQLSRPMLDLTPGAVNVMPAYQGTQLPQAYTGQGVVVGICDIGLDFTNPMFYDKNGQTRIRQAWDIYTGGSNGYAGVGTVYTTQEQLTAAKGTCDSTQYHGTHVAGIATGSAVCDGRYQGIAYEADIVMSLALLNGYTAEQYKNLIDGLNATLKDNTADPLVKDAAAKRITLTSAMEALAIKYVMDYATANGQPCVVNCSFGSQEKLTDDNSVKEELFNSLTGPGRIIVCAAGNYSDGIIYRLKTAEERIDERLWLKSSLTPTLTLRSAGEFTLKLMPDIDGADTLTITSAAIRQESGRKDSARIDGELLKGSWLYTESQAYENTETGRTAYSVKLTLPTETSTYRTPSVAFVLEGDETEVMGASKVLTFNRLNQSGYVSNAPYTVSVPAAFSEVIAVGLTSHRDSVDNMEGSRVTYDYNRNALGQVVSWSGTGPTLEGRMKPDVVAPGHNVVSALNSNLTPEAMTDKTKRLLIEKTETDGRTYYWKAESGSSMSAPVVTGIIALWLQANPQLTPDDVKQILAKTARHPEADEDYPNYRYGYGEIDAYKGLLYLAELSGIEELSDHQPMSVTFSLTGRTLNMQGAAQATVTVYALGGQVVERMHITDGTANLSGLRPGVYAVQIDTGETQTTGSTLVRLQ